MSQNENEKLVSEGDLHFADQEANPPSPEVIEKWAQIHVRRLLELGIPYDIAAGIAGLVASAPIEAGGAPSLAPEAPTAGGGEDPTAG